MRRVDALLADYGSHHRTRGNLVCHAFGITLIVFGGLAMLRAVRVGPVTGAEILVAAGFLFYLSLDPALAISALVATGALDLAASFVGDWRVGAVAFALGWVFQAIGHARYEKNSPAFFRNLVHLLVGPLFLLNEALRLRPHVPQSAGR